MNICVIIPSLNPDKKLINVVDGLKEKGFKKIIIVDDGSDDKHYFNILKETCDVISHYKNLGKGRAIKTAFNYYLNNYINDFDGVVIVDGDNQHHPDDVLNCCKLLEKNPSSLVLGVRDFSKKDIPFRSKFGNGITSFVFKFLCGINISDTQTGLRAIGNKNIYEFMDIKGERFEYETNMLLETKSLEIPVVQTKIQTIYIEENKSSHFNPLKDSWSIYKVIFLFMWMSIASTVIDFTLFCLCIFLFRFLSPHIQIFISTAIARVISSLVNFNANHNIVFKSKSLKRNTAVKYYCLCIVQLFASYLLVLGLTTGLNLNTVFSKIITDLFLFTISFQIQREWVFRKKANKETL